MSVLGYAAALAIGVLLGLMGSGGSILAIPVLVYLMGVPAVSATSYSLWVVGLGSSFGAWRHFRRDLISLRTGTWFGLPALGGILLSRQIVLPRLPATLHWGEHVALSQDSLILGLLVLLMLGASWPVTLPPASLTSADSPRRPPLRAALVGSGTLVGIVTGLVGAGGGFLIIPALLFFGKLPFPRAVGTSLLIMSVNSLLAFAGDLRHFLPRWEILIPFSLLVVVGVYVGFALARRWSVQQLKRIFAWFLRGMALWIITNEWILT